MGDYRLLIRGTAFLAGGVAVSSLGLTMLGRYPPTALFVVSMLVVVALGSIGAGMATAAQAKNPKPEAFGRVRVASVGAPPTHSTPGARIVTDTGWQPLDGGPRRPGRLLVSLVSVVGLLLGLGGGFVYSVGGFDRARVLVGEVATSGGFQPLWTSELFDLELASLNEQFINRELTDLSLNDNGYLLVSAVSTSDPNGVDTYRAINGRTTLSSQSSRGSERMFRLNQVSADAVRTAIATVYADDPDANITFVSISDFGNPRLTISVSIEGAYDTTYREFDAATGEEIPE